VKRTVGEHLDWLRTRLETLNRQLESAGQEQATRWQTEIRDIQLAIAHYEAALNIEKRISTRSGA